MTVPAVRASIALAVYVSIWRVWKVSSATLIVSATDEFLSRVSDSLVAGGTMSRGAIGRMTSREGRDVVSPLAPAGSKLGFGSDWVAQRKTSHMRAPW